MSYTPMTEEVRGDYAHFQCPVGLPDCTDVFRVALAEFDRWLAAHDAEVAAKAKIEALDWAAEHLSDGQKYEDVAALNSWEAVTVCAGVIRARAAEYRKAVEA